MNNYLNYSIADRKTIEHIVTVKEWNESASTDNKINVKYGYVMPIYGGFYWKKTKKELIRKFCFAPIK